jgi:hypothetical protein
MADETSRTEIVMVSGAALVVHARLIDVSTVLSDALKAGPVMTFETDDGKVEVVAVHVAYIAEVKGRSGQVSVGD